MPLDLPSAPPSSFSSPENSLTLTGGRLHRLESRSGASDENREEWLAERRLGITATEMAKLWRSRNLQKSMEKLAVEKLTGAEAFAGNIYTQWGVDREPAIAQTVHSSHGIKPETRVFRAAQNTRWLASPDGVLMKPDGDVWMCEIKTSGSDITIGSKGFHQKRYLAQMVWGMGVLGASKCLYAWEYRLDGPNGGFSPGSHQEEWVPFAAHQELWLELQMIADKFLVELDAQVAGAAAPF